ncbi:MAG: DUF2252 domain-containing protein [Candidatus Phosphoribacter sp.]
MSPTAAETVPATTVERRTRGTAARVARPRRGLSRWEATPDRPDPVALLLSQEQARVQALLPLRHARMAASAFTFYRGSALVMAADLSTCPRSGLEVRLSGDAHLSNFGLFAAPDRRIVFDLNDFDEAAPGPFEWDLLRLATSFVLAAADAKKPRSAGTLAARAAAAAYRQSIRERAARSELDVWYGREDAAALGRWITRDRVGRRALKDLSLDRQSARRESMWTAVSSLTTKTDSGRRFVDRPPLLIRIGTSGPLADFVLGLYDDYRAQESVDRQELLDRYRLVDIAHKVVGVGSVGVMDFAVLLRGRSARDLIVLQIKSAQPSVLDGYAPASHFPIHGERIVAMARLIQADTDVFLGATTAANGLSFYVRQIRDMKWAPDPSRLSTAGLMEYAKFCGHDLARSHARTGDAVAIAAYLGRKDVADSAVATFAHTYAAQVRADAATFQAAVADGRIASSEHIDRDSVLAGLHETIGLP